MIYSRMLILLYKLKAQTWNLYQEAPLLIFIS